MFQSAPAIEHGGNSITRSAPTFGRLFQSAPAIEHGGNRDGGAHPAPAMQRYALAQVRAGRHPFAKPADGGDPPFDTLDYAEVTGRKARTAGMLDAMADRLFRTPETHWPGDGVVARLEADLKGIVAACRTDSAAVRAAGGRASECTPRTPRGERDDRTVFDAKVATGRIASVRGSPSSTCRGRRPGSASPASAPSTSRRGTTPTWGARSAAAGCGSGRTAT